MKNDSLAKAISVLIRLFSPTESITKTSKDTCQDVVCPKTLARMSFVRRLVLV